MKKTIQIFCFIISSFIVMSTFSGCGTPAQVITSNVNSIVELKPLELNIFGWNYARVGEDENGDVYKYLNEKFNVSFKPLTSTWTNWEDKLNMYILSGDIPDIFTNYLFGRPANFEKWKREDILLPLDDYMNNYPNISKRLNDYSNLKSAQGGKYYGIPIQYENAEIDALTTHCTWIRKDWLTNLGLNMPTTIDEFYNVLKAFTFNDPDKNGKNDTYGIATGDDGVYWAYPIFNAFDASIEGWKKDGDTWQPEIISDQMKSGVEFYKKLYDEKILQPDFYSTNYSTIIDMFVTGKIGCMTLNAGSWYETYYNDFKKVYPDKNPDDIFTYVPVMKGQTGKQRIDGLMNYFAFTSLNADMGDEKTNRALMLIDFLLSDDGLNLTRYGIENVNYKVDNGKIVNLIKPGDNGYANHIDTIDGTVNLKNMVTWDFDFFYPDNPLATIMHDTLHVSDEFVKLNPLALLDIPESDMLATDRAKLSTFVTDSIVKIVYQSKDFNKDWDKFVTDWKSQGGNDLIKFTNVAAKKARQ